MKRSLWLILSLITVLGMCLGMAAPALAANIGLLKDVTPSAPNIYHLGDTITYVVTVTNSSPTNNMTINSVQDTFPDATTASLDPGVPYALLPGQSKTYNPAWVANIAPPPNGTVVNTVTVSGFQVTSPPDQFTALVTKSSMVINSRLSVQKTVDFNGDSVFSESETYYAGSPATWKVVVTNSGVGDVSGITLSDSNGHNFGAPFALAASASQTFTYATNPAANFTNTGTFVKSGGTAVTPPPACYANCDLSTGTPLLTGNDFACFIAAFAAGLSYANCDNSTTAPILTGNDFQCFMNKFAAQDASANCDGSTGTPLLTGNDFQCFMNKFAAGCQ